MKRSTKAIALSAMLAALALALMFLSGVLPFASIACPVLASLVLIPVYAECGGKWGMLWYGCVAILSLFTAPLKESAILFLFFGYYPMLRKYLNRLPLRLVWKLLYCNVVAVLAYGLMIYVLQLQEVVSDFADVGKWMLVAMLLLANVSFVVYDKLIGRLHIVYHARLRPKLKL